jgi:hypothetical protein
MNIQDGTSSVFAASFGVGLPVSCDAIVYNMGSVRLFSLEESGVRIKITQVEKQGRGGMACS